MKHFMLIFIFILGAFNFMGCQKEKDVVPPHISGAKDITYKIGRAEPDYLDGIKANDNIDGDLTPYIEVDLTEVDLTIPGIYRIIYKVTDKAGNTGTSSCVIIVIK